MLRLILSCEALSQNQRVSVTGCGTEHCVAPVQTNKLQRVLNAAARVVCGTHKFDRGLSRLLHTELHWLDVPERVVYELGVMVFNRLHVTSSAPMADGLSVWLVRRSGIPYRTACGIR